MQAIIERCCGLDVHQGTVVACLLIGAPGAQPTKEVRTFRTVTRDLEALRDWLRAVGVTHVGMESMGVYWRPVYAVLEGHFELIVGNARHIRNVPGRKTDVKDSEWIADLVRQIAKSFVPPRPLRELRELLRYRRKLVESQAAERNRLLKLLETANIKLASVASDVFGVSGRAMLRALIEGEASNRGQEVGVAHALRRLAGVAREQDAAESGEAAGDRECGQNDPLGVDARQIGSALAIAYAVDGAAECRPVEQENRSSANDGPNDQRIGQAERQIARGQDPHRQRRRILRREAARMHDHQPLRDRVHRQRDYHGRYAQIGDANAVYETEPDAAGDPKGDCQRSPHGSPSGRRRRHHAADSDEPGYRQVDLRDRPRARGQTGR